MRRHVIIITTIVLGFISPSFGQDNALSNLYGVNADSISTDVYITRPHGFNRAVKVTSFEYLLSINPDYQPSNAIREGERRISMPAVLLFSDDEESVIFYEGLDIISPAINRKWVTEEIQVALGDETVDVSDSIKVLSRKEDMAGYANADSAYIYRLTLPQPYLNKYRHCLGVNLCKYAHPAIRVRILMTDNGLGKADEHLSELMKTIRYGNEVPEEGIIREKNWRDMQKHIEEHGPCIHIRQARENMNQKKAKQAQQH